MTQLSPRILIVWYIQRVCLSFKTNSFKLRKEIWKKFNQIKTVWSFLVIPTWGSPLYQWQITNGERYYIEPNESILERRKLEFSSTAAHVIEAVSSLFLVASVLHVVALSFDRYIAVWRPLSHPSVVTKKKVTIWSIVIWSYSCIYMAYRTVLRELNHPIVIINILSGTHTILPSFISVIFYIRIYFALRNNRKRACTLDDSGQIVANACRRERNMTKAMMAVLGLFLLCITPWFLLYQVIGACPTCSEHTSVEMYLFAIFYYIFFSWSPCVIRFSTPGVFRNSDQPSKSC